MGSGTGAIPGRRPGLGADPGPPVDATTTTQIYEGTNQIQRVVMARELLKG